MKAQLRLTNRTHQLESRPENHVKSHDLLANLTPLPGPILIGSSSPLVHYASVYAVRFCWKNEGMQMKCIDKERKR